MADIAATMSDGEVIKVEIIEDEATGQVLVITAVPGSAEAVPPEGDASAKKLATRGRGKKSATAKGSADK